MNRKDFLKRYPTPDNYLEYMSIYIKLKDTSLDSYHSVFDYVCYEIFLKIAKDKGYTNVAGMLSDSLKGQLIEIFKTVYKIIKLKHFE